MQKIDKDRALLLMTAMREDMQAVLNKHAASAAEVAVNSVDPHSPVIACAQMALADASMRYLQLCGVRPQPALEAIVDLTNTSMQKWVRAVVKPKLKN